MKKFLLVLAVGCVLAGCHSKLDLDNVDTSADLSVGLTLPVGSMHLTLVDLIGNVDNLYVDSLEHKGVLAWKLDTAIERYFHQVDLAQYISSTNLNLNVYEKLGDLIVGGHLVTPVDIPIWIDFPLNIKLDGINKTGSLYSERLDSAFIESASFASTINATGGLPLNWAWVDSVTLDLGKQVSRAAGNVMTVYDRNDPKYAQYTNYGNKIPTDIDNFSLVMMKNPKGAPSYMNVMDECTFNVHFKFIIPAGTDVAIPTTAGFDYRLDVQFIDYKAIWGKFDPSKDMASESVIDLSQSWDGLSFLTQSKIPFAEPSIDMRITTQVAGALFIDKAHIFVEKKDGSRVYAMFGNDGFELPYKEIRFTKGEWLPLDSEIGDSTQNMTYRFDKTPNGGRIHNLFKTMPQQLGYKFELDFDTMTTPQIRITDNTNIRVDAKCRLPMIFGQGVQINYPDTLDDISISQMSIDSLQADIDAVDTIKTAKAKLIMKAYSRIPLQLKLSMRCLDEKGNIIMDPKNPSQPFMLFDKDTLVIVPPSFDNYSAQAGGFIPAPRESQFMAELDKEDLNLFTKIKKISYKAVLDDDALAKAYADGLDNVKLTNQDDVTIKIGLAAKFDAILNFGKDNNK